jgi:O-antigen ligase
VALFSYTGNFVFLGVPFGLAGLAWIILNWKSVYWFFLFSIPLSCEIELGSFSTTVPDEPLMLLFVPLMSLLVAFNYKRIPAWFLRHPITLILFLQFVWLVVAVIFSENHILSFKYLAAKIWFLNSYILLPVIIFREQKDFVKAFRLFAIPALLHALFAFTWHFFLNFDYWASNDVVRPFYVNHVDYSTVISMLFPLCIIAYQLSKGKVWQRRILLATIIFLIPAIFYAGARAAMLGVIFSFVISFAIRRRFVRIIMPAFYLFVVSVFILLAHDDHYVKYRPNMKYTATQRTFEDLITATFRGTDMSSMERFYRWIAATRMSTERPFTGVGPNNFYDYYKGYTSPMFKTWVSRNPEKSTSHNYFLFMLVEQGWPAMILYGILVMAVLAQAQRIYHQTHDPFYKKATMGLTMMFAVGFVNNFFSELLETHKIGALFYLSITLLIVIDYLTKKQNAEKALRTPEEDLP